MFTTFIAAVREMKSMMLQLPKSPNSSPMAVPMPENKEESFLLSMESATADTPFKSSIFTDSTANGPAHMMQTDIKPNTPAQLFITPAAESTIAEVSEIIPPTTGKAPDIKLLAVFTALESTAEPMAPIMLIYELKAIVAADIMVAAAHLQKR